MPNLEEMKGQMAQRMNPNAAGGGLPAGAPSSAQGGQYPPGAASGQPTPGFPDLIEQVMNILLQGNPADAKIFGAMVAELQQMVEEHQARAAQGPPAQPQPQPQM